MGFVPVPCYCTDDIRDDKCKDPIEEEQEKYDNDDNDDKLEQEDPDSKSATANQRLGKAYQLKS